MPIIDAKILSGRTVEQKHALIREITEGTIRALGVSKEAVRVIITEVDPDHWGAGGVSKAQKSGKE